MTPGEEDFRRLDLRLLFGKAPKLCFVVRPRFVFPNEPSFVLSVFNPPDRHVVPSLLLIKEDGCPNLLGKLDDAVKLLVRFDDKPNVPVSLCEDGPSFWLCRSDDSLVSV